MKPLVRYILHNRLSIPIKDWEVQGFGFMRLRLDANTRLHIWDSRLRTPGVSDVHDHAQWGFTSHIISGNMVNIRYSVHTEHAPAGERHHMATIECGVGGGMPKQDLKQVFLVPKPELYLPGDVYRQEPDEVHRTIARDGTVTIITQERTEVTTARVFWPLGGAWGDAIPRQATPAEVDEVGRFALSVFG